MSLSLAHPLRLCRYAVLFQDTRGRFGSDGDFVPVEHEKADGAATVRWARAHEVSEKVRLCNRHVTDALQCTLYNYALIPTRRR